MKIIGNDVVVVAVVVDVVFEKGVHVVVGARPKRGSSAYSV